VHKCLHHLLSNNEIETVKATVSTWPCERALQAKRCSGLCFKIKCFENNFRFLCRLLFHVAVFSPYKNMQVWLTGFFQCNIRSNLNKNVHKRFYEWKVENDRTRPYRKRNFSGLLVLSYFHRYLSAQMTWG